MGRNANDDTIWGVVLNNLRNGKTTGNGLTINPSSLTGAGDIFEPNCNNPIQIFVVTPGGKGDYDDDFNPIQPPAFYPDKVGELVSLLTGDGAPLAGATVNPNYVYATKANELSSAGYAMIEYDPDGLASDSGEPAYRAWGEDFLMGTATHLPAPDAGAGGSKAKRQACSLSNSVSGLHNTTGLFDV